MDKVAALEGASQFGLDALSVAVEERLERGIPVSSHGGSTRPS